MGVHACGWERVCVHADGSQKLGSVAVKMRIMYGLTFLHGLVNIVIIVWACRWVLSRIDRFSLGPNEEGSKRGCDSSRGAGVLARGTRSCT